MDALEIITATERATYQRDGVVCLRSVFPARWIYSLRHAIERILPDSRHVWGTGRDDATNFRTNAQMWLTDTGFREFVTDSQAGEIAGRMMGSSAVRILKDQIFVKEPGSETPTPWHHDLPYWSVDGDDVCSIWMPLDDVDARSGAVEYVRGSHRWDRLFTPNRSDRDVEAAYEEIPDIDNLRDHYDIVTFDVQPGDCIVFHARTVHGAPGNTTSDRRRRAYSTRWAGDDATYCIRPTSSAPSLPTTLASGDALDGPEFPVIWKDNG